MFNPIVIFIIFMTFAFGIIAIDIYIRKKYENTMRELNKMCIVFKNTSSYGVFFHCNWSYKLTKKGIVLIASEDLKNKYQSFLIFESYWNHISLGYSKDSRIASRLLPPINSNLTFSLNEIKMLLNQHLTISRYGSDVRFINRAKLENDFISKTLPMLSSKSYSHSFDYYNSMLCFKHGAYVERASFRNFHIKLDTHIAKNYRQITKHIKTLSNIKK